MDLPDIAGLVEAANAHRWRGRGAASVDGSPAAQAEARLEARFATSRTLAVYGTLAPGQPNHHVVAPLGGEWTTGVVRGDLAPVGWGATLGYPAFRPREGGGAVPVQVLASDGLADAWPDLDRFEGPEYRRILVPVFHAGAADERRLLTVANLYAAAHPVPVVDPDPGP